MTDEISTDFESSGQLNLFDKSQGTLQSVSMDFYGEFTTEFSVTNRSRTSTVRSAQVSSEISMVFNSPISALDQLLNQGGSPLLSWFAGTGGFSLGTNASRSFGPFKDGGSAHFDISASELLSAFLGSAGSKFDLACATSTGTNSSFTGGNGQVIQTTTASCGAAITYFYTASVHPRDPGILPEPALLSVMSLALAYLGVRSRRRPGPAASARATPLPPAAG